MTRRPAVAPLLYGLLLAAMATGQLADADGFAAAIEGFRFLEGTAPAAAYLLPSLELAAAVLLLTSRAGPKALGRAGGALGLALAVFWSAFAAQAFARGFAVGNCGCFGVFLVQELRWWVLLEDVYMLALAWYAAANAGLPLPRPRFGTSPARRVVLS